MIGSYSRCRFNFLINCQAVFQNDYCFAFLLAIYESSSCSLSTPTLDVANL